MKEKEYRMSSAARGGLLFMRGVPGVALGDRVVVRDHRGRKRNGQVIRTSNELVLIQVFEGTDDLDLERTWVRFLEEPFEVQLSRDLLGRIFNGIGMPRDNRPPIVSALRRNVNGAPMNPAARAYPREFIQTGISTIDGLNSLVRGQKLPIFSGSGLPHNRLAAQIVRQAKLIGEEAKFAVVFAAMGVSYSDARFFEEDFESSGVLGNVVMFINMADDPPIERLILPRTALTAAEYLAYELTQEWDGGLPAKEMAAAILLNSRLAGGGAFVVVFVALGLTHHEYAFYLEAIQTMRTGFVAFVNRAHEPVLERLLAPRLGLTAAEYLAFDLGMDVLVVVTDMTNYAEALREVATAKGDVPSRKGYPGYLYSDLAEIYERAGRVKNRRGSITMVPVLSMPSDDITHPIPDLTGYITEGQIVLSRELHMQGVYPPVNVPPSLSRLMKDGIGKDDTREDHPRVASQIYAAYARALEVRNLASIIGAEELGETDRQYLAFATAFEERFVAQKEDEDRSIIETLTIAWQLLSMLPPDVLTRVREADLAKYHHYEKATEAA